MKRLSTVFLCIIMCLLLLCYTPKVYAESYSGTCGQNLTWSFDGKTGELVISGSGEMDDYFYDTPWEAFTNEIKTISIGDNVTSIGHGAFSCCEALTDVTIGSGVTSIGSAAFDSCINLSGVTIPESVASIGVNAFNCCNSLTGIWVDSKNQCYSSDGYGILFNKEKTVLLRCPGGYPGKYIIPNCVESINLKAFESCINLTSVTIPNSVTSIGMFAFSSCKALTNVTIGNGITYISDFVFSYCENLTSVTIPDSVTSIGGSAFSCCESLMSITIPDSVTSIGDSAFYSCTSLMSVTIPNGVTSIGASAFHYCSFLKEIVIPNSITSIGDEAFCGSGLISVTIPSSITVIPYALFKDCVSLRNVIIPNSITNIEKFAFSSCAALESIIIPDSVISIGDRAFYQCQSITSVILPNTDATIGKEIFQDCTALTCVTIPSGLSTIGYKMFYRCSNLEELTITEGVTSIGDQAFSRCASLSTVSIPESVSEISHNAFGECFDLTRVIIYNPNCSLAEGVQVLGSAERTVLIGHDNSTTEKYAQKYGYQFLSLDDLPQPLVGSCGTNVNWTLNLVTGEMLLSGSGAMFNYDSRETPWKIQSSVICSVIVSDGITSIGNSAFSDCENLANLHIGEDVRTIGDTAFCRTDLKNVEIPYSVTNIGDCAFGYCSALETLSISGDITSIGNYAFASCYNLQNFTLPDSVESIGSGAFEGCLTLTSMTIPCKVTIISDFLFNRCGGLIKVTLPNGIERIGNNAFSACESLEDVIIPQSVSQISDFAFSSCTGLKKVSIQNGITIIGTSAFKYCENLTDIMLPASLSFVGDDAFYGCTNLAKVTVGNPKCKIYDRVSTLGTVGVTVLWGYDNSTVQDYALKYGYRFESLGASPFEACPHAYTTVVMQPSCTEQGYTTYTCSLCGGSYIGDVTEALGHDWDNGTITLPPTATEDGIFIYSCTRCGETETESIPATGEADKPCDGGASCPSNHFTDVEGPKHWTHKGIDFAVTHGLFSGMSATTFKPDTAMTRAMLVTVLWRYAGEPIEGTNSFTDVPNGTWYTAAVTWAAHNGVVAGVGNNKFNPDGKITREQMAAILYRYAKSNGIDTSKRTNLSSFPDSGKISGYAKEALQWAVAEGLVNGSTEGGITYLQPQGNATRAQVAAILMRFIQNVVE